MLRILILLLVIFPTHLFANCEINYILERLRDSNYVFIRNGHHYDSTKAAAWLRWKMHHKQYASNPIRSGYDFVERVSVRSERTGTPYEVITPTGRMLLVHFTRQILIDAIDYCL